MKLLNTAWCRENRAKPLVFLGAVLFASGVAHLGVYCIDGGAWEGSEGGEVSGSAQRGAAVVAVHGRRHAGLGARTAPASAVAER